MHGNMSKIRAPVYCDNSSQSRPVQQFEETEIFFFHFLTVQLTENMLIKMNFYTSDSFEDIRICFRQILSTI